VVQTITYCLISFALPDFDATVVHLNFIIVLALSIATAASPIDVSAAEELVDRDEYQWC
jgi:hypothetical protein